MSRLSIYHPSIGKIYKVSPPGKYLCMDQTYTDIFGRGACSTHGGYLINPNPNHKKRSKNQQPVTDQRPVEEKPAPAQVLDPLPAQVLEPLPAQITDLATYLEFFRKLYSGAVTGLMVQKAWQDFKSAREQIRKDLAAKKKEEILRFAGGARTLSDTKEALISSAMSSLTMGFNPSESLSYNPFDKNAFDNAIEAKMHLWTDDLVQKKVEEAQAERAEMEARKEAIKKALKDPQTLEDFKLFLRYEGREKLSPEQLARYDLLTAQKTIDAAQAKEKQSRTVEAVTSENIRMELKKTVHSKKGYDLFVVVLLDRVEKDVYNALNTRAKKLGGYYSAFRGQGAIPGFQFTTEEAARAFMSLDTVEKEGKESNAPAKLIEQAERREEAAREDMNRDRLTNTARRARMAAGKEADLERDIIFAQRLKNVAEGISRGEIKILAKLSSATELQTLLYIFNQGRMSYLKSIQDTVSKETLSELRAEPFNEKHIQFVKFPIPFLHREGAFNVATTLERVPGFKLLANRIGKKVNEAVRKQDPYVYFSSGKDLEDVRKIVNRPGEGNEYWDNTLKNQLMEMDRVLRLGIVNPPTLRAALRELIPYLDNVSRSDPQQVKIKEMERDLVGRKIPGFFPTPYAVVDQLLKLADIGTGDSILEPSAGKGNIAEGIRQRYPNNPLQLIEYNYTLAEILRMKGFNVIHGDFLTYQEKHDKIIMNPPFENRQDIAHIKHAYSLLKPGGRLVAIMSAGAWSGSGKVETAFQDWYNQVGIISPITLESGTFKESNTMVRTVIIAADKVEGISGIGCSHKTCHRCGGWKRKPSESISGIMDYCSPKCQAATRDFCECKCGGKYHGGRGGLLSGIYPAPGENRVLCYDGVYSSSSGRGTCSRHGGLKDNRRNCEPCENTSENCFAVWMSIAKIRTDENRFQNRQGKFSDESVQKIVQNFDENKLDPVTVWQDPADGYFYILSGHSRLEAHRIMGKTLIPARVFKGSEAEAIRYGKVDANRSGTAESLAEDISAFVLDRDGNISLGVSKLTQAQLKERWGGNYHKLENFSYLNTKGKFLEVLGTPAQKNFPYIENKAGWAGYMRKVYPALTNLHENEIFDFLFSPAGMNMRKEDFFQKADMIINRLDFNPSLPLNLQGSTNRGTNARADTAPAQAQLREIDKDMEKFRLQRRNANTQAEKEALNKLLARLQGERDRLERDINSMVKSQASLFGIGRIYGYTIR